MQLFICPTTSVIESSIQVNCFLSAVFFRFHGWKIFHKPKVVFVVNSCMIVDPTNAEFLQPRRESPRRMLLFVTLTPWKVTCWAQNRYLQWKRRRCLFSWYDQPRELFPWQITRNICAIQTDEPFTPFSREETCQIISNKNFAIVQKCHFQRLIGLHSSLVQSVPKARYWPERDRRQPLQRWLDFWNES